jgi:quinolinate synthase
MAEVADIMTAPNQKAILPDLAAGCSMADMANLAKVERCWRELNEVLNAEEEVTPVTYINSAADLKAFCGEHGGIVCTSSNAGTIAKWAFERRPRCCSSPTSISAGGPATTWASRWTRWSSGIPISNSAA